MSAIRRDWSVRSLGIFAILFLAGSMFSSATSADTTRDLQHALDRLKVRLGHGPLADMWRNHLRLNALETQAAKGARGNVVTLADIRQRFASNSNCLWLPELVDVQAALTLHLNQLNRIQTDDLAYHLAAARSGYRQIPLDLLRQRRDRAVYDLRKLHEFYSTRLPLADQATIEQELAPQQIIAFLENLKFELPPEVSAGKLLDQMSQLREQIEALEQQMEQQSDEDNGRDPSAEPPQPDDDSEVPIEPPAVEDPTSPPEPASSSNSGAGNERDSGGGTSRMQRQEQIDSMRSQFEQLRRQRESIRELDGDRQQERARVWRELTRINRRFVDLSETRRDTYFETSHFSFSKFAFLYFYATDDNLQAEYAEQLDRLEQEIWKLQLPDQRDAAAAVGDILGWLEATDLAPDLVAVVQRKYSLPNLWISVSNQLANQLAARPVNDTRPVNEILFGRLIQGTSYTTGNVTIDFVDDPNQAQLSLHLAGQVQTRTYTQERRITAYSNAAGSFDVRRSVLINVGGILIGIPCGSATLSSQFCGVDCRLRLVQRIADRQYQKEKYRNEQESIRRLRTRVIRQFQEQSDQSLGQAKARLNQALANAINLESQLPELYLRTTSDRLWAVGHKADFKLIDTGRVANLAAHRPATGTSVNAHVAIQIHESLLANYLDPIFVNRTFTNDELANWAEELTGEKPEGLATDIESGEESWSITFAAVRPVQFEFDNHAMVAVISGRRFSQGDTRIQTGLKIRIPFKIKRRQGKLVLIRDGDASIDYAEPEKKNARVVAFKSFLETKLNSQKQADAALRTGVELPDNLIPVDKVEKLQEFPIARTLHLVELRMTDGWMNLGWNRVAPGTYLNCAIDTPAIWPDDTSTFQGAMPIASSVHRPGEAAPRATQFIATPHQNYQPAYSAAKYGSAAYAPNYYRPACYSGYGTFSTPTYQSGSAGRRGIFGRRRGR